MTRTHFTHACYLGAGKCLVGYGFNEMHCYTQKHLIATATQKVFMNTEANRPIFARYETADVRTKKGFVLPTTRTMHHQNLQSVVIVLSTLLYKRAIHQHHPAPKRPSWFLYRCDACMAVVHHNAMHIPKLFGREKPHICKTRELFGDRISNASSIFGVNEKESYGVINCNLHKLLNGTIFFLSKRIIPFHTTTWFYTQRRRTRRTQRR